MTLPSRTDVPLFHWSEDDLSLEDAEVLLEDYTPDDGSRYKLRDFFSLNFPEYCKSHQVPEWKLKVMNSITACKTGKLGYTLTYCDNCGRMEAHPCACGNRNCPSCGYLDERRWVALRQAEVIPGIPYFHLVFTLPHELMGLMYQNQEETLKLLFRSVKDTILALSRDKLQMVPGILMVLHTFGSDLSLHYHLHVLVPGGGLTLDKQSFKSCLSNTFFLPAKALKRLFRGKFMDGLKELRSQKKLSFFNDVRKYRNDYTWKELLNTCYSKEWNVDIRYLAPVSDVQNTTSGNEESTDNAITYFARYTNRTAISNNRILRYDKDRIWFRYKDYREDKPVMKTMVLAADEFIRRFLMHLLPPGFTRIRSAGFLACCVRKKSLERIYKLLHTPYEESPVRRMDAAELIRHFYGRDISICEKCHGRLDVYPRMGMMEAARFIRGA